MFPVTATPYVSAAARPRALPVRRLSERCRPTIRLRARPYGGSSGRSPTTRRSWPPEGTCVFQGGPNEGVVRAVNARTGEIVWTFRTGSDFRNSPITYIGPDGRQYVAFIGSARTGSEQVTADTEPDDGARFRRAGSALYVFALPATPEALGWSGARREHTPHSPSSRSPPVASG